ncbi:ATP-dependent zinc protease [Candidatus Saccharibacteria bacterium]|nr:ATP-dependent zinc protease [Candidatus Saccharibacteria bacterium]
MNKRRPRKLIGRVEKISFPTLDVLNIPARIDTGAKTSTIWVSNLRIDEESRLTFNFFGRTSPFYQKKKIIKRSYSKTAVASSMGAIQTRYKVRFLIKIEGKKIRASFTLADRSQQVYPILIGRNILRGKFIVDVKKGQPLKLEEKIRSSRLRSHLKASK